MSGLVIQVVIRIQQTLFDLYCLHLISTSHIDVSVVYR
jgi:hypothetical protein